MEFNVPPTPTRIIIYGDGTQRRSPQNYCLRVSVWRAGICSLTIYGLASQADLQGQDSGLWTLDKDSDSTRQLSGSSGTQGGRKRYRMDAAYEVHLIICISVWSEYITCKGRLRVRQIIGGELKFCV